MPLPRFVSREFAPVRWTGRSFIAFAAVIAGASLSADARDAAIVDALKQLSLEELMEVEVTSVSKRSQKLSETAAAVQVISADDIRRSGATTIPQALRLASHLHAAQLSSSYWTIGSRGFNSTATTSNKMLVLMDGRSVYSPLFSGVFWDTQDTFLPDLGRIEVISGPGGATWGANAVNGIISLITKPAAETQGGLIYAGAGNEDRGFGGLRYGGQLGSTGHYRVYAKTIDFDGDVKANGSDARNRWVFHQTGFRADGAIGAIGDFTLQGDVYQGWVAQPTASRGEFSGGNLLARWTRALAPDSQLQVQAYVDRARRKAPNTFSDVLDTFDLDAHHEFSFAERHRLIWGVNYRLWADEIKNTPAAAFLPPELTTQLAGIFVQDEIELVPRSVLVTLGAKFEYNDYSGSDWQPSVRAAWRVNERHTLWGAVSRAVRTPSRVDRDLFSPPRPPFFVGGGSFESEILIAYELGWRGTIGETASFTATGFYHDYSDLRSLQPGSPITIANGNEGETYGLELWFEHRLTTWLRWSAGYTSLRRDVHAQSGQIDLNRSLAEGSDPEHELSVRLAFDLPGRVELNVDLRHVGEVPTVANGVVGFVPEYAEVDARVAWWANDDLELSVVGRNLSDPQHPEAGSRPGRNHIERSVHGRVSWRF